MEQKKEDIYLSSEDSYNLYKLFYEVSQLLEKNGIVYWITAGTFLGAVRSGGIIKWDDDIDIMIPIEYKNKLYKLFENNKTLNIYKNNKYCNKIKYRNTDKYFIDIFYSKQNRKNGKIVIEHHNKLSKKKWPNEYFYIQDLFPLRKYKFGAYEVYSPNKYHEFMERNFSKKWNTEAVISHSHTKKLIKKIYFTMKQEDYEPAKPFFVPKRDEKLDTYELMYEKPINLINPEYVDNTIWKVQRNKKIIIIFYNIFIFFAVLIAIIIIISLFYLVKK
jgi:lipopolysaccharide cholinephosphotransferase